MAFAHPEVAWDFRLEQVRSINVSNHKFGLVYPGMGIVIFRNHSDIPEELVFKINYLGGEMLNYSLNFSRSAAQIYLQYYNFLRLGREGYALSWRQALIPLTVGLALAILQMTAMVLVRAYLTTELGLPF